MREVGCGTTVNEALARAVRQQLETRARGSDEPTGGDILAQANDELRDRKLGRALRLRDGEYR